MEQPSDGDRKQGASSSHGDLQIEYQIMLTEYSALRTEIDRRANVQWHVYALQLASAGAVSSLAISSASNVALLLIIPLSSYMLGSRYILHDFHIKLIQRYVRESLSGRLRGKLERERWKKEFSDVGDRRWFSVTGWNLVHPTRLAFEGVAILALVAVLFSAARTWWTRPRVHSGVGDREGCGYDATGLGSHGRLAWARVMASRMVSPWLRADVRYELIKHHRSRVWSVCQYPETA